MKLVSCFLAAALAVCAACTFTEAAEPLKLVATIPLKGVAGKLDHLVTDSKGDRLFVANKPNNTLDIVDLKAKKLIKQIPDQGKISGVAYASDLDMIYVGNGVGECNAFDARTYEPVFSTPAKGADNVQYHSGNKKVYVGQDEILSELDGKTGQITASINLPGAVHGFRIDKKAERIYAVLTKQNLVAVIDIAKHEVVETFPMTLSDAGSPIAQDADQGLLFVGCPKTKPMVIVFDIRTGKELASVPIPAAVDDLHFDSKRNRLYASCGSGSLVVIEKAGEEYKVTSKLVTPKDARTCAWSKSKLYLGVPKTDKSDGPAIQVYETPALTGE